MRKSLAVSLAAILCAAGLAACGDSGSSSSSSTATVPTTKLGTTIAPTAEVPYTGTYMGDASDGRTVTFSYKDGNILNFKMGDNLHFKEAPVKNNKFRIDGAARGGGLFWEGTWTGSHSVEGTYNYYSETKRKDIVTTWTAQSFAHGNQAPIGPTDNP
jgi:hypothetical protein